MWQEERQQKIRALLAAYGQVSADRVADEFGVSRETIRRDFVEMEAAGELKRLRGGAVPVTPEDPAFDVRITQRLKEKRAICVKALSLLSDGQTIFMDGGSTLSIMAEEIAGRSGLRDLTIITNSLEIAMTIAEKPDEPSRGFRVVLLGGDVKHDPVETFGPATIIEIQRFRADVSIISPWGIELRGGAMDHYPHSAEVARAMVNNAATKIILADHSKLGVAARTVFCPIEEIDYLVVDPKARENPAFNSFATAIPGLIVAE